MELNGMSMSIGIGVGSSPPPSTSTTVNPKKKRRTNINTAQAQVAQRTPSLQDFVPPPLSGFGDTVIASNPFDDTPQTGISPTIHNGPQQIHHHHPHHLGSGQGRGMNPLATGNMNTMMPHIGNVNSMANAPIGSHVGHMGNMSNANHLSINNMNPINNMRPNMSQNSMGSINHINMNHIINSQINNSAINSPINGLSHGLGSPMGGSIGSSINNMSPNHMANSNLNVAVINATNALPHNAAQPSANHLNNIRTGLNRPHNITMPAINPTVPGAILGTNQMNNLNIIRSQITNIQNVNLNQRNQLGNIVNAMSNASNNLSGKSPSHGINIGNAIAPHGLQIPSTIGPKPIPESTGKVYPPDQPMVFNHQNPNAPPISPCGVCHKEVHANDQAILCESGCNFWFHRRCTGLSEIAYDLLMQEVCAEWVCDRCMQSKNVSLVKFKP